MREKRKGYPARVSVGYRANKKMKNLVEGKSLIIVRNLRDLEKASEKSLVIIGKVGKKKKIEILKKAEEKKIKIYKTNVKKFLKGATPLGVSPVGDKPKKSELGGKK